MRSGLQRDDNAASTGESHHPLSPYAQLRGSETCNGTTTHQLLRCVQEIRSSLQMEDETVEDRNLEVHGMNPLAAIDGLLNGTWKFFKG